MNITLPDGSVRALEAGSNGLDLANDIGPGLAKAAIAVSVNGIQKDLCDPINEDSEVSIITIDSDEGLETIEVSIPSIVTCDLRLNEPRYASLPNIMKAKKKPLEQIDASELGVDIKPRIEQIKVEEPPKRKAGIKVANVSELVQKLKNEAKVI